VRTPLSVVAMPTTMLARAITAQSSNPARDAFSVAMLALW